MAESDSSLGGPRQRGEAPCRESRASRRSVARPYCTLAGPHTLGLTDHLRSLIALSVQLVFAACHLRPRRSLSGPALRHERRPISPSDRRPTCVGGAVPSVNRLLPSIRCRELSVQRVSRSVGVFHRSIRWPFHRGKHGGAPEPQVRRSKSRRVVQRVHVSPPPPKSPRRRANTAHTWSNPAATSEAALRSCVELSFSCSTTVRPPRCTRVSVPDRSSPPAAPVADAPRLLLLPSV